MYKFQINEQVKVLVNNKWLVGTITSVEDLRAEVFVPTFYGNTEGFTVVESISNLRAIPIDLKHRDKLIEKGVRI